MAKVLYDPERFASHVLCRPLRSYQAALVRAVVDSVVHRRGLSFTVMLPRQSGKNYVSAVLECYLLVLWQRRGGQIVKASPTFKPQSVNSMLRVRDFLEGCPWTRGRWRPRLGYMVELGQARVLFFSADPASKVVGATADLLLEIDEAQDVDADRFSKDFAPMAASSGATRVLFGTAWTSETLLATWKRRHLELEAQDGVRRHFELTWRTVAAEVPEYGRYVEEEIDRLGAEHVLIQTQYEGQEVAAGGGLFSAAQQLLLRGQHARQVAPREGGVYVAGLDVASADEQPSDWALRGERPRHDQTVLLIGELVPASGLSGPRVEVVECYANPGATVEQQYGGLEALIRQWGVSKVFCDATGIGQPVAAWLADRLGSRVVEYPYTQARKSEMGYDLLALINGGRLAWWKTPVFPAGDLDLGAADAETREFWTEVRLAQYELLPSKMMRWGVRPAQGFDDVLNALALLVLAAGEAVPILPGVRVRPRETRDVGRY